MACGDCDFVIVDGVSLPGVSGIEERPVYIGDAERSVSGVLRPNFRTVAREWTVLLSGVSGVETRLLEEHLRTLGEVLVNVQGVECFALVTVNSKVRVPRLHSSWRGERDLVRSNWEILIRETQVETVLPGVSYQYAAFTDVGAFTWDWDAAGQPAEVDVLLVGGGGGGGEGRPYYLGPPPGPRTSGLGGSGGGAGGVVALEKLSVDSNITGFVGAGGGSFTQGQDTTFGSTTAYGGGHGGASAGARTGGSGGSGGGGRPAGAGTPGQGHHGGTHTWTFNIYNDVFHRPAGGGGAGAPGMDSDSKGGDGVDLLALGWNYRLIEGAPRFVGGGGAARQGTGGVGGGGAGGTHLSRAGNPGQPNTGGGGGGGLSIGYRDGDPLPPDVPGGSGGSGLVIVRWLVSA